VGKRGSSYKPGNQAASDLEGSKKGNSYGREEDSQIKGCPGVKFRSSFPFTVRKKKYLQGAGEEGEVVS